MDRNEERIANFRIFSSAPRMIRNLNFWYENIHVDSDFTKITP